uniref:Uncharacterized protein n=1 Tax=Cacopsylla melanoneura TaxID=428564 RepID=A0A8D9AZE4_9HEMI
MCTGLPRTGTRGQTCPLMTIPGLTTGPPRLDIIPPRHVTVLPRPNLTNPNTRTRRKNPHGIVRPLVNYPMQAILHPHEVERKSERNLKRSRGIGTASLHDHEMTAVRSARAIMRTRKTKLKTKRICH